MSEGAPDSKGMPTLPSKPNLIKKDEKNKGSNPTNRNILVVRHGSTAMNDPGDERIRAWIDVPLDEKGIEEAKAVGRRLKGLIDVIIASDLIRTRQTAKEISKETGAPIIAFTKAARPWDVGDFAGKPVPEVLPLLYKAAKDTPGEKLPGGESFDSFRKRWLQEVKEIEKAFPDKRIAIVTHHRNERMYDAWKKKGAPENLDFDWDTFAVKGIPPGNVLIA